MKQVGNAKLSIMRMGKLDCDAKIKYETVDGTAKVPPASTRWNPKPAPWQSELMEQALTDLACPTWTNPTQTLPEPYPNLT